MNCGTVFYSGGKDSHFVLYDALKRGYKIPFLVNFEPVPHSDGIKYFNCSYDKKIIETHSKMMGIPVCYYRFGKGLKKKFKDDRGIFLKDIIEFIKSKSSIFGIKKITIFIPWILDDIISNRKTFKRYSLFKEIFKKNNADFIFSVEKETSVSIVKKCLKEGIKSICISVPEGKVKKNKEKTLNNIKGLLEKNIDINFLKEIVSIETEVKKDGGYFPVQDVHSMVVSSPIFKEKINICKSKIYSEKGLYSLKIFFV